MSEKLSFINKNNIFISNEWENLDPSMNKLFCTFTSHDTLEDVINLINRRYTILFSKIFILESPESDELMCTYNIDAGNIVETPMDNTILLHRKKETNTLYTINALNTLIRSLNNGVLDKNYVIEWVSYKNSILLTEGPKENSQLRRLNTSINRIINLAK